MFSRGDTTGGQEPSGNVKRAGFRRGDFADSCRPPIPGLISKIFSNNNIQCARCNQRPRKRVPSRFGYNTTSPRYITLLGQERTSLTYVRLTVRSRYDIHSRHPSSFQALSACRRHRRFPRPRPDYRQAQQCGFGGRRRLAEHSGDALPSVDSWNARIHSEGIEGTVGESQD